MGEIATSERQITLYYISTSSRAKQTLAYVRAEGVPVLEIDLLKNRLTGSQIAELAEKLHLEIHELVNQEHYAYRDKFEKHNLSSEDWITMIRENPDLLKQPIALRGNRAILVETPSDILKL